MIKNYIDKLNYKSFIWLIIIYCIVTALIMTKGVFLLPYFLICISLYYIIYKHPISAILILLLILYPMVFQMTPDYNADYSLITKGFRAEDIILLLMGIAIIQKLLKRKNDFNNFFFSKIVVIFFLLLIFNILRNISHFGLSSFGEFRLSYLILILPLYISLFFNTIEIRKQLFLILIFASIFAILLSIPFIVSLKGWAIGTEKGRFLSSQITLGLIYAVIGLILSKKYNLVKFPHIIFLIITIPTFILLIADSHRSVWFVIAVAFFSLYLLGEIKIKRLWLWGIWIFVLTIIVYIVFVQTNLSLISYVKERLIAFVSPSEDSTSFWRLAVWDTSIKNFLKSPLLGQGFGGYWYMFVPELNSLINLPPHNLYIHTIVKLGLIGLSLYLIIILKLYKKMKNSLVLLREKNDSDFPIIIFSIMTLIAAHFYYLVYSFDYFSMFYIGLGSASILNRIDIYEVEQ